MKMSCVVNDNVRSIFVDKNVGVYLLGLDSPGGQ